MSPESLAEPITKSVFPKGWLALRGCRLDGHVLPLVLLHPQIGVAILGGPPEAVALFRQRLDHACFFSIYAGHLPVVRLASAEEQPEAAFAGLPPLSLPGEDAWILTARRALEVEAPQGQLVQPSVRARRRRRRQRLILLAGAAAVIFGGIGIGVILPVVSAPLPLAAPLLPGPVAPATIASLPPVDPPPALTSAAIPAPPVSLARAGSDTTPRADAVVGEVVQRRVAPHSVAEPPDLSVLVPAAPTSVPQPPASLTGSAASFAVPVTDTSEGTPNAAAPTLQSYPPLTVALPPAAPVADVANIPYELDRVPSATSQAADRTGPTLPGEATAGAGSDHIVAARNPRPRPITSDSKPIRPPQDQGLPDAAPVAQLALGPGAVPISAAPIEGARSAAGSSLPALSGPPSTLSEAAMSSQAKPPLSGESTQTTSSPSMVPQMRAALLRRGKAMFALGDISSARLFFRRAAEGGSAIATTALGKTYNPGILTGIGVRGLRGDRATAAGWYQRAITLGDREAEELLAKLVP